MNEGWVFEACRLRNNLQWKLISCCWDCDFPDYQIDIPVVKPLWVQSEIKGKVARKFNQLSLIQEQIAQSLRHSYAGYEVTHSNFFKVFLEIDVLGGRLRRG